MVDSQMRGIFHGYDIVGAGLKAEMQRAEVIAINLSHLQDVGNKDNLPYRRRSVIFEEVLEDVGGTSLRKVPGAKGLATGVRVSKVYEDTKTPFQPRYDPSHHMADETGHVLMTNVNMFKEMVDLKAVQRSFQANLAGLRTYRGMIQAALQNMRPV